MRTRQVVKAEYKETKEAIKSLQGKLIDLEIEEIQICDDEQSYSEKMEEWDEKQGRKKIKVPHMVGRIHFIQEFKDGDTGKVIEIERNPIVRLDGVWEI